MRIQLSRRVQITGKKNKKQKKKEIMNNKMESNEMMAYDHAANDLTREDPDVYTCVGKRWECFRFPRFWQRWNVFSTSQCMTCLR